jgi:hypothetical protein
MELYRKGVVSKKNHSPESIIGIEMFYVFLTDGATTLIHTKFQ